MNSWSLWATASSKVVQVHREIQQRSPISGSRRPSITSMLSSTIGNTSLIAAQVDFDQVLWKLGANLLFQLCVLFSEKAVRTLQIQGRRGQVTEAWSSNLRVGRGGQFGQLGQLGQIGQLSQLRPSFIFTLAWSDPYMIPEQHFSQQSDFYIWARPTLARPSPLNTIVINLSCKHLQIRQKTKYRGAILWVLYHLPMWLTVWAVHWINY